LVLGQMGNEMSSDEVDKVARDVVEHLESHPVTPTPPSGGPSTGPSLQAPEATTGKPPPPPRKLHQRCWRIFRR
jgi:hypothetical protein